MKLGHHLKESLKLRPEPSPWPRMTLAALSVGTPLFLGYALDHTISAIQGSLFGFLLILNDHFGPYRRRILHLITAFAFMMLGLLAGAKLQQQPLLFVSVLFVLSYLLGKVKSSGPELERMLLFTTLQLLSASQNPQMTENLLRPVYYSALSLANYIVCLTLVYFFMHQEPNFQNSKWQDLKRSLRKKSSARYALTISSIACLGYLLSQELNVERGYWVVGTVLIVMMPDRYQSLYKSFQRLLGTLIGAGISMAIVLTIGDELTLIILCTGIAFLIPLGLIKNYWLGSVFVAGLIILLLDISMYMGRTQELDLVMIRITDIALGCALAVLGTFIASPKNLKKVPIA